MDVLAWICPLEVGIDGLCEGSRHREGVLGTHGERTGSSGTAWKTAADSQCIPPTSRGSHINCVREHHSKRYLMFEDG